MLFDTVYPADSVEFCPASGLTDKFVCGTYKLLENEGAGSDKAGAEEASSSRTRIGKTMLFEATDESNLTCEPSLTTSRHSSN